MQKPKLRLTPISRLSTGKKECARVWAQKSTKCQTFVVAISRKGKFLSNVSVLLFQWYEYTQTIAFLWLETPKPFGNVPLWTRKAGYPRMCERSREIDQTWKIPPLCYLHLINYGGRVRSQCKEIEAQKRRKQHRKNGRNVQMENMKSFFLTNLGSISAAHLFCAQACEGKKGPIFP